jgi:hypothetical protein
MVVGSGDQSPDRVGSRHGREVVGGAGAAGYQRKPTGSKLDPFKDWICEQSAANSRIRDIRDRCRQLQSAGSLDHGSQSRRAVKPRRLKHEVIVGRNRAKAAHPRGVDCAAKTRERLPLVAELHQRHSGHEVR